MRYLFITSPGLSGGLQAPAHELADEFRGHGQDVDLIHIGDGDFVARLQGLLADRRPDLALSFGGFGDALMFSQPGGEAQNLWGLLRIPFFKIIYDVHGYMPQHHHARSGFQALCYAFKDHAVLRARHERPRLGERAAMIASLPPLLPLRLAAGHGEATEPAVYFHKNGNSSAALEQSWRSFPPPLYRALGDVATAMRAAIDDAFVIAIAAAVDDYIAQSEPDRYLLLPFQDFILAQVDDYIRRVKGELIVRQLKDLPVIVNGRHWDYLAEELGDCRLRFIAVADHHDTSRRIQASLATIDFSPNVDLSVHERSLRAIAFGHGLIAQDNRFARDNGFPHSFRLTDGSLPALVDRAIADAAMREEFALFRSRFVAQHSIAAALDHFAECAALLHFANARDPGIPEYLWWPPPG